MRRPDPATPPAARTTAPMASRRVFLRGLAGVAGVAAIGAAAGCDLFGSDNPASAPPEALTSFLAATAALADRYDAVLAAADGLPASVSQVRDNHRAHVKALAETIGVPTPKPTVKPSGAPSTGAEALATLVTAEKAARDDAVSACVASPPRLVALLGSIAAARASHLEVLK